MKRIGILTAGGDTPALNATIVGAVHRANQFRIEVFGIIKGFSGLLNPEVPHVHLNPLFQAIPELDATRGGTILGARATTSTPTTSRTISRVADRLQRLQIDGLICVGGDGTLNGMQAALRLPARRAGPQDDRQRPRAELSRRDQRVGPRARRTAPGATSTGSGRDANSASTRWSTTRRRATPRRSTSRRRASSGSGPPPRAIAGWRSSR